MKSSLPGAAAALTLAAFTGIAGIAVAASQPSGAEVVKARQANFKKLGGAFKALNDETRASAPDAAKVRANAQLIADLAKQLPLWFPAGSGPSAGAPTGAKAEIWSDAAGFKNKVADFQGAAAKLGATPVSDAAALTAASRSLGQQCASCHSAYREKDKK